MGDAGVHDLLALDRDVARGVTMLAQWRAALALDPASCVDEEPLQAVRRVTGKSTWDALGSLDVPEASRPVVEALRRWVYFLLQARVGRAEEAAWALAAVDAAATLQGDNPLRVSWRDAWRGVVRATTPSGAQPWLEAAAEIAPRLSAIAARRAARRVEVARRLGLEHPSASLVDAPRADLRAAAAGFLAKTDELWAAMLGELPGAQDGAAAVIPAVVARDAGDGWPARLNPRWLREVLGEAFVGAPVAIPALPEVLGATTFMRALQAFAFALRSTPPSASAPFVLVRAPAFVAAHRLSFVVGSLPADAVFQMRMLGVGRRTASAQARVLARSALFEARLLAIRSLLGDDAAPAPRDVFDELTARTFGRSLDPRLRGAWPAARDDEPARWLALLEAPALREGLRDRFDVDWFRNPRAWEELRAVSVAREPVREDAVRDGAGALARAFEGALG